MTIKESLASSKLPAIEAEILLADTIKKDRSFLYTYPDRNLTNSQIDQFNKKLKRRLNCEPIAYILGYKDFYGLRLKIDKRAMIPRHETEDLVEATLEAIKGLVDPTLADVGTGSGCIAITIAANLPKARILATDISRSALTLAKENIRLHKMPKRIKLIAGDLLSPIEEPLDLVVANLPYIPTEKIKRLESEVKDFEPQLALDGGSDGMKLYRRLFEQAKKVLKPGGFVFYEIDGAVFSKKF